MISMLNYSDIPSHWNLYAWPFYFLVPVVVYLKRVEKIDNLGLYLITMISVSFLNK